MTLQEVREHVLIFCKCMIEIKENKLCDEHIFQNSIDGLAKFWEESCKHRQLSLNVLKVEKLQAELDSNIAEYNKLNTVEQALYTVRFFNNTLKTIDYLDDLDDFEPLYNQDIDKLEESIAKAKVIVSLHEFKFRNTNTPRYNSYIKVMEQVLSLKRLSQSTQNTTIINNNSVTSNSSYSKYESLKTNLYNNGFYELTKVKSLSHDGQSKLIDLLVLNDTPYNVAMFDFLGFFKQLTNENRFTNTKIHSIVSSWFDTTPQTIKCNMLVLNERSELRKNNRYTSHLHKEKVKTDYYSLK